MRKDSHNLRFVSVIVVNWNGVGLLKDCFDSVFAQSYKNFEVIMVDCASRDDSIGFVRNNYPQVKLIKLEKDLGPPYAINLATKMSKGDYVLILNNDVYLPEDLVEKMTEELKREKNYVITPVELNWNGEYVHSGIPEYWIGRYLACVFRFKTKSPFYPSTACCMTTKEILLSVPLNQSLFMYEDAEWGWRLHLNKIKIKVPPNAFFFHKGAGTKLDCSPRQAFYVGRVVFVTCFICFRYLTFVLVLPVLFLTHLRNILRIVKNRKLKSVFRYLRGIFDFFKLFGVWQKRRKEVQTQRAIGDFEVLKLMTGSVHFEKDFKKKWMGKKRLAEFNKAKRVLEKTA